MFSRTLNWVLGAIGGAGMTVWLAFNQNLGGVLLFGVYAVVCTWFAVSHLLRKKAD